jgi:hypothetical protein
MGGITVRRVYIVLGVLVLLIAISAYSQTVNPWDAAYEADPADTDLVSQGDDEIRALKSGVRERGEVSQVWDEGAAGSVMGYHLEGTAFADHDAADCSAIPLHADQEAGQLCHEIGDDSLWIAEAGGGSWVRVTPSHTNANGVLGNSADGYVPENAIILWDAVGGDGDENCDGVTTAGDCPCGYTKANEYDGLTIRGADEAAGDVNIPDAEGEDCEGDGSGNDPPCVTQAGRYDDTITITQMPAHTHEYTAANLDGGAVPAMVSPGAAGVASSSTGGGDDHYHPFRTVLFCRKN